MSFSIIPQISFLFKNIDTYEESNSNTLFDC